MMRTRLIQAAHWLGWSSLGIVLIPVFAVVITSILIGPHAAVRDVVGGTTTTPDPRLLSDRQVSILVKTIGIGSGAVVGSFAIALPAVFAMLHTRHSVKRSLLYAAMVWPLLAPPCVIAYAWDLLATQKTPLGWFMIHVVRWNARDMAPWTAAWVESTWLWPVPALALVAGMRLGGTAAYRLALLDAAPTRAFLRAAIPSIRGIAAAAAGVVFLLAITDTTIAPLMRVPGWWPIEMQTEAMIAARFEHPTAYLVWRSWPMMLLAPLVALVIWLLVRPAWKHLHDLTTDDLGSAAPPGRRGLVAAWLLTLSVSLLPMAVFLFELKQPAQSLGTLIRTAWATFNRERDATLVAAALTGAFGILIAISQLAATGRRIRTLRAIVIAALILLACLPPVVIGQALITVFDRPWHTPWTGHRTLYDDTPFAWVAGLLARFGFIAAILSAVSQRVAGDELDRQARVDGATTPQVLAYIRVPQLRGALLSVGLLLGCLAIGELPISVMLVPVRFRGSLAVSVDQQIHFGRYGNVVALSLLLTVPAMLISAIVASMLGRRRDVA